MKKDELSVCRCRKCGYEWVARVATPRECPRCKCRKWDEPRKGAKENKP
jgi:predicted Zn-ribbon and HTH transcriptional regulator